MGQSIETVVRVVALRNDGYMRHPELDFVQHEGFVDADDVESSALFKKAYKALKGVEPGDRVEVVWDFDHPVYPIVRARRLTGTLEARVSALERALKAAGIPIPQEGP